MGNAKDAAAAEEREDEDTVGGEDDDSFGDRGELPGAVEIDSDMKCEKVGTVNE